MIAIDHKSHLVTVTALGEFMLGDFKEFEALVNFKVKFEGPVNLLFDLREMTDFSVDMALEEIRFSRAHRHDFGKIAVLTESQWVTWSAWLSQVFVSADLRVFADADEAMAWLEDDAE